MSDVHGRPAKGATRKAYGPIPPVIKHWTINSRPVGDTGPGEQASPSFFAGTEAEVKAYCDERTAASKLPGGGPVREYVYAAE